MRIQDAFPELKAKEKNRAAIKRGELRETFWPKSKELIWVPDAKVTVGWIRISRLIPLVMHLIKKLAKKGKGNPSLVYLELWARSWDDGIVSIDDEKSFAFGSGYSGSRAVRTWHEHMLILQELGFIKIASAGVREIAHVLMVNPLQVCAELVADKSRKFKGKDDWWNEFRSRAIAIKANIPGPNAAKRRY